jgi:hypothetical protein
VRSLDRSDRLGCGAQNERKDFDYFLCLCLRSDLETLRRLEETATPGQQWIPTKNQK